MHLKAGDRVILPSWSGAPTKSAPVWGGSEGYVFGVVETVHTHHHDQSKHSAVVSWNNKQGGAFHETQLRKATNDEVDIALDQQAKVPLENDVWVLIKTSLGNFALNVIEAAPYGKETNRPRYVVGTSRRVLPTIENNDYNLVGNLIMSTDFTDVPRETLYSAAQEVYQTWKLPSFTSLALPLPEFDSVREAAKTAPTVGPAVLFFHLPRGLKDYADDAVAQPS